MGEQVEELNQQRHLSTRKKGGLVTMPFIIDPFHEVRSKRNCKKEMQLSAQFAPRKHFGRTWQRLWSREGRATAVRAGGGEPSRSDRIANLECSFC